MARRFPFTLIASLLVLTSGGGMRAQVASDRPAQFQSGVELVLVDVTVLGRDGAPVTTLGPADFSLTVDKRPRRLHSVRLVGTAAAGTAPAAGVGSAAAGAGPRSFILIIDREHIPIGEGQEMLAAAAKFVDSLGPDDRVALWTTAQINASIRFTESRESIMQRIRTAVGVYRPPLGPWNVTLQEALEAETRAFGGTFTWVYSDGSTDAFPLSMKPIIERECHRQPDACPRQVQNQVTELAREARHQADTELAYVGALLDAITPLEGPKHIVLVTGGPVMTVENFATVQAIGAKAALARATIHALQVHDAGSQARPDQLKATAERFDQSQSAAYALAGATGGLAVTPVSGEIAFTRLARELSASYLLAFEIEPADRDGKAHEIGVKVQDRGWGSSVRARQTFRFDPRVMALGPPAIAKVPPTAPAAPAGAPAQPVAPEPAAATPSVGEARPPAAVTSRSGPVDPAVDQVVRKMADYVAGYGPQASVIVGVEKYTQQVTIDERHIRPRNLVAEFAIVNASGRVGWTGFRDVVEVDGEAVADRRDRLVRLLTGPPGAEVELRRIADESARYNVGPVVRNFNSPTTALFFFHPALVDRFTFRRKGTKTIDGVETWELDFRETRRPTLVMKRDGSDVPCDGTVWVAPADGTVVRTRLRLRNFADQAFMSGSDRTPTSGAPVSEYVSPPPQNPVPQTPAPAPPQQQNPPSQPTTPAPSGQTPASGGGTTTTGYTVPGGGRPPPRRQGPDQDLMPRIVEIETRVDIDVTYRRDAASGIWLPSKMSELYEGPISRGTRDPVVGRCLGTARYSDFKRFETSTKIVLPQ